MSNQQLSQSCLDERVPPSPRHPIDGPPTSLDEAHIWVSAGRPADHASAEARLDWHERAAGEQAIMLNARLTVRAAIHHFLGPLQVQQRARFGTNVNMKGNA
jgi:hypothetical protein